MSSNNDPLWALVAMAFDSAPNAREGAAAVLRVIADEVVPPTVLPWNARGSHDDLETAAWLLGQQVRGQRIRQRLLAEAERAEAGR